ncbi:phosphoribosyl-ATP diphosphatase [bacterium]|nr:phosphoribosyl-ATP diphosphatase [bacterium]
MLICSIDLIGGQAVQLRQGKEHVLTSPTDPLELAREFNRYGEVAVIDLDAAMGKGDNLDLIRRICQVAQVRVGGGIRDKARAEQLLRAGARQLIVGTAATPEFLSQLPPERVMVALDQVDGKVVDHGWTQSTGESVLDRARRLAPHCGSFLCTFVEDEGGMKGMDLERVRSLAAELPHPVTVAGGIATGQEIAAISRLGMDVQVGMALYTGAFKPADVIVNSLDFDKVELLPTIVQDPSGQVLMLAYSSRESLGRALNEGLGIYYSRSRQEVWEKGATSGHRQKLLACRTDCDRDALLFVVEPQERACHRQSYSCFGGPLLSPEFSLHRLFQRLQDRRDHPVEGSYTAKLLASPKLLQRKIMEEAFEVATYKDRRELVWEIADALYFMSTLAVREGIEWSEIEAELGGRQR